MQLQPGGGLRVRVPASSANLGPGFDTLGLALNLYNHLEVHISDAPGVRMRIEGSGADSLPVDGDNLIVASLTHVLDALGVPVPGLELVSRNDIPTGRGLGSSAAAIVAGVLAARALAGERELSESDILRFANEIEGHPDNVAPALFGGLTIAWLGEDVHHKRLQVHRGVSVLVAVPEHEVKTELARSLQPESVPVGDAVFNVSRSALLVAALTQSPELLLPATEDRLHQSYRASAMPETDALVRRLREAGHAAVVSGAGPSVLVFSPDPESRMRALEVCEEMPGWEPRLVAVDTLGGTVEPLP